MKAHALLALSILLAAGSAHADLVIYNSTPTALRAEITLPNGKVEGRSMSVAVDSVGHEMWIFSPGVTDVKVALKDDTGAALWQGTVGKDEVRIAVGTGKGVQLVAAGIYGGSNAPRAASFINLTGEPLTIDLEGGNGVASHRGIAAGTSFGKATALDEREASFEVKLAVKGEAPIEIEGKVTPTYHYAIWKGRMGYRLVSLGNLPPPPPATKATKATKPKKK